jgi:hypothetical protein
MRMVSNLFWELGRFKRWLVRRLGRFPGFDVA